MRLAAPALFGIGLICLCNSWLLGFEPMFGLRPWGVDPHVMDMGSLAAGTVLIAGAVVIHWQAKKR